MHDHIFRKYDIRGIFAQDLLLEEVYTFGRALAYYFLSRNVSLVRVIVAMDGRIHSQALRDELTRALRESGLDVVLCGVCPTPVFYFAMQQQKSDCAGVMITASHNGKEYNGFKICYGKDLISADDIIQIRELYKQKARHEPLKKGSEEELPIIQDYISWLVNAFSHLKKSRLQAVIDCGNGSSAAVIPELVQRMEWSQVTVLYETIDGEFPHRSPDPTKQGALSGLAHALETTGGVCGVAFDGDADRVVAMTEQGTVLAGDSLLALFSEEIAVHQKDFCVVFDGKCSQVLSSLLSEWNIPYHRTPTGHAAVKAKMGEVCALLGGELSNHFMFCDRYFGYDDGIYAMMRLFEILERTQKSLGVLYARFPKSYTTNEVRIPCQEHKKTEIVQAVHGAFLARTDVCVSTLDGVRVDAAYGWGIVRASNTEPVISFSCESMTHEGFEQIKKDFMQVLEPLLA